MRHVSSSSGVTSTGPSVVTESLPFVGPSRTCISANWRSRADQSMRIVYPAMYDAPVVGWHVAPRPTDHRGDLQLEVEQLASRTARGRRRVDLRSAYGLVK